MSARRLVALSVVAKPADPPTEALTVLPREMPPAESNRTDRVLRKLYVGATWALVVAIVAVLALSFAAFVLSSLLALAFVLAPWIPVPVTLGGVVAVLAFVLIASRWS